MVEATTPPVSEFAYYYTPLETSAKEVAQVSQPAVSPTSKSAGHGNIGKSADWEIRDPADLEVCATKRRFAEVSGGADSHNPINGRSIVNPHSPIPKPSSLSFSSSSAIGYSVQVLGY
jgi:hypothetical protein